MKALVLILALSILCGCTKTEETDRVLRAQGFTNVQITGYRFFGRDEKDFFHTGFTASSSTGQSVEGVVCAGWFKGSTVRFD